MPETSPRKFLPYPGDELHSILPPNRNSLASVLGLALEYLKVIHRVTSPAENARTTGHILQLFIQDPLVQSLLPKAPPPSHPAAEELSALQVRLASLEHTIANLPRAQASMAAVPQHPSIIGEATAYIRSGENPGGTNVTTQQLTSPPPPPHYSEAALPAIAAEAPQSLPNRPNIRRKVRHSTLKLLGVPHRRFNASGTYTSEEAHDSLKALNVFYANLKITRGPTWLQNDPSNSESFHSSLIFSFEDPDGSYAKQLRFMRRLRVFHCFGYVVKPWQKRVPKRPEGELIDP